MNRNKIGLPARALLLVLIITFSTTLPVSAINSTLYRGAQAGSIYENATITAGGDHTCAILDDGSVRCWGSNSDGQLGDGTTTSRNTPTALSSWPSGRTAVAITAGGYHTCAILDDGSVRCWGYNSGGQLGDGTTTSRNTPTAIMWWNPSGRTTAAITAGDYHTCAIFDDGSVRCWGWNDDGQLGDGTTTSRNTSTALSSWPSGRTAVAITAGDYHTCAILDDGSVRCWGYNNHGQLGDGTSTNRYTPTSVNTTAQFGLWPSAVGDRDNDDDGLLNIFDSCANGNIGWTSGSSTDYDSDGCRDASEDLDDDNDGVLDTSDDCATGDLNWTSDPSTDHDADGCRDAGTEDNDDDDDGVLDASDDCATGDLNWTASATTDHDSDGCQDSNEDADDDNDGMSDIADSCPFGPLGWTSNASSDVDSDGCPDEDEDADGVVNPNDNCPDTPAGEAVDGVGCSTSQLDTDSDGVSDADDACPGYNDSIDVDADGTPDGCDSLVDSDSDGVADADDLCADTMVGTDVDSGGCAIQAEEEAQAESSSRIEQLLMAIVALLAILVLAVGVSIVLRRRLGGADEAPAVNPEPLFLPNPKQ